MTQADNDFLRYSCQIALPGFTESGQEKLLQSKVLIVGAGGLGCPAAQYLAASGIGYLAIADDDIISATNLHRQVLYSPDEIGKSKATTAANKLQQQNPSITVKAINEKITTQNALSIIAAYDVVVDGTDNFDTKYLLNDACVLLGKPLVYGAIYQYDGQVAVWNADNGDGTRSIHYRDVFPEVNASQIPDCAEGGVIPTLAGIIGCMQANEVIKLIIGTGEVLAGKLLVLDAQTLQSRQIKLERISHTEVKSLPDAVNIPLITISQWEATKADYMLIDVRNVAEREAFHIGGINIPLDQLLTTELPQHKPLLFYCASGKRSAEAVKMIKKVNALAEVYSLQGGIKTWKEIHASI